MKKLKLDLDQLTVDSFDTLSANSTGRGTVKALITEIPCPIEWNPTYAPTCAASCASCASCQYSCDNTCGSSCYGSCSTCPTNCEQESCVYVCP